jgi:hypothetical protein
MNTDDMLDASLSLERPDEALKKNDADREEKEDTSEDAPEEGLRMEDTVETELVDDRLENWEIPDDALLLTEPDRDEPLERELPEETPHAERQEA